MITDPITTVEAAEILGLSDASVIRHRILAGTLISEKRGRDLYVSRRTIQAEADAKNDKRNGKKGGRPPRNRKGKSGTG